MRKVHMHVVMIMNECYIQAPLHCHMIQSCKRYAQRAFNGRRGSTCHVGDGMLDVMPQHEQQMVDCKEAQSVLQDVVYNALKCQHDRVLPGLSEPLQNDLPVCCMNLHFDRAQII